ncbi:CRISPR-associated endoribonuclease cas2 [Dorea sp. 5-2]|nr:CRISPR-associated endoribonuclease cas2 [Dorea sp. 5-2]
MENYFWNTEEKKGKKVYILVIYDIVSNKRRTTFAKKMNGYGFRVQKSAFEAMIPIRLYNDLLKEIPKLIHSEEDSVRVYRILGQGEVSLFGVNESIKNEEVIII